MGLSTKMSEQSQIHSLVQSFLSSNVNTGDESSPKSQGLAHSEPAHVRDISPTQPPVADSFPAPHMGPVEIDDELIYIELDLAADGYTYVHKANPIVFKPTYEEVQCYNPFSVLDSLDDSDMDFESKYRAAIEQKTPFRKHLGRWVHSHPIKRFVPNICPQFKVTEHVYGPMRPHLHSILFTKRSQWKQNCDAVIEILIMRRMGTLKFQSIDEIVALFAKPVLESPNTSHGHLSFLTPMVGYLTMSTLGLVAAGALTAFLLPRGAAKINSYITDRFFLNGKPSQVIAWFSPEIAAHFETYHINPTYLAVWIYNAIMYLVTCDKKLLPPLALQAAELFSIGSVAVMALVAAVSDYIRCKYFNTAHASPEEGNLLTAACDLFGSVFTVASKSDLMTLAKDLTTIGNASRTADQFLGSVLGYMPVYVRTCVAKVLPQHGWAAAIQDLDPKTWMNDCSINLTDASISLSYTSEKQEGILNNLYTTSVTMRERLIGLRVDPAFDKAFQSYATRLENWKRKHFRRSTVRRTIPFVVMFYGPSGTGKSVATVSTIQRHGMSSYTVNPNSKHWDGYAGQDAVIFDDWCATTNQDQLDDWFTLVSNAPFGPDMSSLNDPAVGIKGTMFTSPFIFASTNTPFPKPTYVHDHNAIYRRRHMLVEVLKLEDGTRTFRLHSPTNPDANAYTSEAMNYDQFLMRFEEMSRAHFREEKDNLERIFADHDRLRNPYNDIFVQPAGEAHAQNDANFEQYLEPVIPVEIPGVGQGVPVNAPPRPPVAPRPEPNFGRRFWDYVAEPQVHEYNDDQNIFQIAWTALNVSITATLAWFAVHSTVTLILMSLAALYLTYKYYYTTNRAHADAYGPGESGKKPTIRRTPPKKRSQADKNEEETDDEEVVNVAMGDPITGLNQIAKNACKIDLYYPEGTIHTYCLGSSGVLIFPRHYISRLATERIPRLHTEVERVTNKGTFRFSLEMEYSKVTTFALSENDALYDLVSYPLDNVTSFPNAARCVAEDFYESGEGYLFTPGKPLRPVNFVRIDTPRSYVHSGVQWVCDVSYYYKVKSENGDCGSFLCRKMKDDTYKIVGLHTFGQTGHTGHAFPITRSDILDLTSGADSVAMPEEFNVAHADTPSSADLPCEPNELMCEFANCTPLYQPTKHDSEPSVIQHLLPPPITGPSVLTADDPRVKPEFRKDPLVLGMQKLSKPGRNYNPFMLAKAKEIVREMFQPHRQLRKFNTNEAIYGIEGGIEGLNFRTSAGYPFNKFGKKRTLFFRDDGTPRVDKRVTEALEKRRDGAKVGQRVASTWTDVLKSERRALGKIEMNKTRTICSAPVDYTILFREYFLDFICSMKENLGLTPSLVGIDINSPEYHQLITRLSFHPNVFATDMSNNDGEFPICILEAVGDIIDSYYNGTEEDTTVREVLVHEVMFTYHYCRNYLYLDNGGLNSGFGGTTAFNTIGNILQAVYDIIYLAPKDVKVDYAYIRANFQLAYYGDDNVSSYSDNVSSWYSPQKKAANVNECGRHEVAETKLSEAALGSITTISILKQTPGRNPDFPGIWVPLFDKENIEEIPKWIRRGDDPFQETRVNIDAALRFAFWHGKEYHDTLRKTLLDAYDEASKGHHEPFINLYVASYDERLNLLRPAYFGWNRTFTDAALVDIVRALGFIATKDGENLDIGTNIDCWALTHETHFVYAEHDYYFVKNMFNTSATKLKAILDNEYPERKHIMAVTTTNRLGLIPKNMYVISTGPCSWLIFYQPDRDSFERFDYLSEGYDKIVDDNVELVAHVSLPSGVLRGEDHPARVEAKTIYRKLGSAKLVAECATVDPSFYIDRFTDLPVAHADIEPATSQLITSAPVEADDIPPWIAPKPSADDHWNFTKFLSRWINIQTVDWIGGVGRGGDVTQIDLPYGAIQVLQQKIGFASFDRMSFDLRLRIECAGTSFHQGKLVYFFMPAFSDVAAGFKTWACFGAPHQIVDASGTTAIEMVYPFTYAARMLHTQTRDPYVKFVVRVLSALQLSGGATTAVPITIYAMFENIKLELPNVKPTTMMALLAHGQSYSSYQVIQGNNNEAMKKDVVEQDQEVDPSAAASVAVKGNAGAADASPAHGSKGTETKPKVTKADNEWEDKKKGTSKSQTAPRGPIATSSRGGNSPQTVASPGPWNADESADTGLDLAASYIDAPYVVMTELPFMYNAQNLEPVYEGRMYPGTQSQISKEDATAPYDEMLVDNLVIQPAMLTQIVWNTQTSGTRIALFNCSPTQFDVYGADMKKAPTTVPWMQAIATLGSRWTGDIIFSFVFTSNRYQTGRLLFAVAYGDDQPASYAEAQNCYSISYDIACEEKSLAIRIPYMWFNDLMDVSRGINDTRTSKFATLHVYVVGPLTAPPTSPQNATIDVFISAANNFQVVGRSALHTYKGSSATVTRTKRPVACGGPEPDDEYAILNAHAEPAAPAQAYNINELAAKAVMITPQTVTLPVVSISGERLVSLKDMWKCRFCSVVAPVTYVPGQYVYVTTVKDLISKLPGFYLNTAYLFRRGSTRFTFRVSGLTGNQKVAIMFMMHESYSGEVLRAMLDFTLGMTSSQSVTAKHPYQPIAHTAFTAVLSEKQSVITVELPYVGYNRYGVIDDRTPQIVIGTNLDDGTKTPVTPVEIYPGFADETRLFHLFQTPAQRVAQYYKMDSTPVFPSYWT